jgi:hypothetical protein
MKTYGAWKYGPTFLDLDTRQRGMVSFELLQLYPLGNSPPPQYLLDGGFCGPRVDLDAVEKKKILQCRESNSAVQPVASSYWYYFGYG